VPESEAQATFKFNIETDKELPNELATSLESLRVKVVGSTDAIKQMSSSLRSLRGDSDQVKAARAALTEKLTLEKNAVSAANLKLLEQGVTYEKLAQRSKALEAEKQRLIASSKRELEDKIKAQKEADKERAAQQTAAQSFAAGLRLGGVSVDGFGQQLGKLKGLLTGASGGLAFTAIGLAVVAAAAVAAVAGIAALAEKLGSFIVNAADAARSMNIMREAAGGSAENAYALGTQVDDLSRKLSTPKDKLNELAVSLTRSLSGSAAGGQGIVDTFEAVSRSADAMGDEVGNQLRGIIERSKLFGRVAINPFELQGTGLQFQGIAGKLAQNLHISVQKAQQELFLGRVKIDDAAKAINEAVQDRFGKVNAEKLLSLPTIFEKFHEKLDALAKGVNLTPLLTSLSKLADLFDTTTVTGDTLKTMVEALGNAFGSTATDTTPLLVKIFKELLLVTLKVEIEIFRLRNAIRDVTPDQIFKIKLAFAALAIAMSPLVIGVGLLTAGVIALAAPFTLLVAGIYGVILGFKELAGVISDEYDTYKGLGGKLIDGLVAGLEERWTALKATVRDLGNKIKAEFKSVLGIRSPSTVFREYGEQTAAGYAQGVDGSAPDAQAAVGRMAPSGGGRGAARASGGGVQIYLHLEVHPGGESRAKPIMQAAEDSLLPRLTKAFEDLVRSSGLPTQTPVTA
jgi:hypothetical protein